MIMLGLLLGPQLLQEVLQPLVAAFQVIILLQHPLEVDVLQLDQLVLGAV